jgi:predicted RNase H-like HicB family nuclease
MEFRVVVEAQPNAFHAYCPNLKGCHSWGTTVEEAMEYIEEALQFYVDNVDDEDDGDGEDDSYDLPPFPYSPVAN